MHGLAKLIRHVCLGAAIGFAGLSGMALSPSAVLAQPAGVDPGKDCHTIRNCNFRRGGVYRGCISTYSCRVCKFVPSNCTIDGQRKVCRQLVCGWGAA